MYTKVPGKSGYRKRKEWMDGMDGMERLNSAIHA